MNDFIRRTIRVTSIEVDIIENKLRLVRLVEQRIENAPIGRT